MDGRTWAIVLLSLTVLGVLPAGCAGGPDYGRQGWYDFAHCNDRDSGGAFCQSKNRAWGW